MFGPALLSSPGGHHYCFKLGFHFPVSPLFSRSQPLNCITLVLYCLSYAACVILFIFSFFTSLHFMFFNFFPFARGQDSSGLDARTYIVERSRTLVDVQRKRHTRRVLTTKKPQVHEPYTTNSPKLLHFVTYETRLHTNFLFFSSLQNRGNPQGVSDRRSRSSAYYLYANYKMRINCEISWLRKGSKRCIIFLARH